MRHGNNGRPAQSRLSQDNGRACRLMNVDHVVRFTAEECFSGMTPGIPGEGIAAKPTAAKCGQIVRGKVMRRPTNSFQLSMNRFHQARHPAPMTACDVVHHKHTPVFGMIEHRFRPIFCRRARNRIRAAFCVLRRLERASPRRWRRTAHRERPNSVPPRRLPIRL